MKHRSIRAAVFGVAVLGAASAAAPALALSSQTAAPRHSSAHHFFSGVRARFTGTRGGAKLDAGWLRGVKLLGDQPRSADPAVPVGALPSNSALDPATHTLYVTNYYGNTVSVLDAATCNALNAWGCSRTPPTVQVGNGPFGLAVDQATDTVYVANYNSNTVSVIDGATCNAENTSGCNETPPAVMVGSGPVALDVNEQTDSVYVANLGNGAEYGLETKVSVIDGQTCNGQVTSGCGHRPPTVRVASGPEGVIVDQSTDTVYTGSENPNGAGVVSVINGATCDATVTSGCTQTTTRVGIGTGSSDVNVGLAIDPATKTLYAANSIDNTLSMINVATCNALVTSGCGETPNVVRVGADPNGISFNGTTGTIYVANNADDTLSVLDPSTCNAVVTSGCGRLPGLLRTGGLPTFVTTDEITDTIYTPNGGDNTVSVLNGATCNAKVTWGCARFFLPTVEVGNAPAAAVVDQASDTVYVPNSNDNTVSVTNGASCNAKVTWGCRQTAPAVAVGAGPVWAALDSATHTLYVANDGDDTVSVIDTVTCNAIHTLGCNQTPPTVAVGSAPVGVAIDQQTDTVYVANYNDNTVSVIDGATCNAGVTKGCGQTAPTVAVGDGPDVPAVNETTDTVYVPNSGANTVSVIDGATCNATVTSGCGLTPPTVTVGNNPDAVAVDPGTHTVYAANTGSEGSGFGSVSVINAATCDAEVSSGCGQTPPTVAVGAGPDSLAINQATGLIFVANSDDDTLSMIDGATCNAEITAGCDGALATIPVGGDPSGPAVNQATDAVYVPNHADNNMSVFGFGWPSHVGSVEVRTLAPSAAATDSVR